MLDVLGSAPARTYVASTSVKADAVVRLLFVDDDCDFREAAEAELEDLGFSVTSFADGWKLLSAIAGGTAADAIVLDWNMPAMNGLDLLKRLRQQNVKLPVLFLTGRSTPTLEGEALDQGALDFVDKTRGLPILARRIRKIVEATKQPPAAPVEENFRCGLLELNGRTSRAFWNGKDVDLTVTEFRIVSLLATTAEFVTYRAIYDCVRPAGFIAGSGEHGYRCNVRSTIKRIRNKFRVLDPAFDLIENYASFGYRWNSAAH